MTPDQSVIELNYVSTELVRALAARFTDEKCKPKLANGDQAKAERKRGKK